MKSWSPSVRAHCVKGCIRTPAPSHIPHPSVPSPTPACRGLGPHRAMERRLSSTPAFISLHQLLFLGVFQPPGVSFPGLLSLHIPSRPSFFYTSICLLNFLHPSLLLLLLSLHHLLISHFLSSFHMFLHRTSSFTHCPTFLPFSAPCLHPSAASRLLPVSYGFFNPPPHLSLSSRLSHG